MTATTFAPHLPPVDPTLTTTHLPPNIYSNTPGTAQTVIAKLIPHSPPSPRSLSPEDDEPIFVPQDKADLPPLIAQYGTASATTWLEDRYRIWRANSSTNERPRIQGYLSANNFVFAWGNPLCYEKKEEMRETAEEMFEWVKEEKKKLVWCCVDETFAKVLAEGVNGVEWSTLSCIQEDGLHPDIVSLDNKDVKHNIRRAEKSSVNVEELRLWAPDFQPDELTKKQIEEGLDAWEKSRTGRQIASASLLPWLDASSRRYYVARTPEKIVGLCILTPIAHDSYQIKNAVTFPDAPKGTSEFLLARVIEEMKDEGHNGLTFGTSATPDIIPEHNIGGWKIKMLSKGYKVIAKKTGLTKRGDFRAKFETEGDRLYVCFPPKGFGWTGLAALMKMLRA